MSWSSLLGVTSSGASGGLEAAIAAQPKRLIVPELRNPTVPKPDLCYCEQGVAQGQERI